MKKMYGLLLFLFLISNHSFAYAQTAHIMENGIISLISIPGKSKQLTFFDAYTIPADATDYAYNSKGEQLAASGKIDISAFDWNTIQINILSIATNALVKVRIEGSLTGKTWATLYGKTYNNIPVLGDLYTLDDNVNFVRVGVLQMLDPAITGTPAVTGTSIVTVNGQFSHYNK